MDKSEGTDVVSKFIGSISEKLSGLYIKGQNRLSRLSLQRMRAEKITELGDKLFKLLSSSSAVSAELFKEEYAAIVRIDNDLAEQKAKAPSKPEKSAEAPKTGRRKRNAAIAPVSESQIKTTRRGKRNQSEAAAPVKAKGRRGNKTSKETPADKPKRIYKRPAKATNTGNEAATPSENETPGSET
jgi:hypothetical protein